MQPEFFINLSHLDMEKSIFHIMDQWTTAHCQIQDYQL